MRGVDAVLAMLDHAAPGMLFPEHDAAEAGDRVYLTPHRAGAPAGWWGLRKARRLAARAPDAAASLLALYRRHNGVALCEMPPIRELQSARPAYAVSLLPVDQWARATQDWLPGGEKASFMEGCDLYRNGTWRVIGGIADEGMSIVMFFDGEFRGVPQAGKCYCIGLDGILGFEEVLADSFDALLTKIGTDIVGLLNTVGFTWTVKGRDGSFYGDPPGEYLADARSHPALMT